MMTLEQKVDYLYAQVEEAHSNYAHALRAWAAVKAELDNKRYRAEMMGRLISKVEWRDVDEFEFDCKTGGVV